MSVDIVIEDPRWQSLSLDRLAEVASAAVLNHFGLDTEAHEVSLLACDDARIAKLNASFRDKAQATNVLSWPTEERGAAIDGAAPRLPEVRPDPHEAELGDIAISYDTCAQEAAQQGIAMEDHCTHLLVHALLHLLGYDHLRDRDATLMEGIETEILGKMGITDPYRADSPEWSGTLER